MAFLQSAGLTLASFALLISVIVFFHELGHLLVAKWVGVKAVRFSIGFGPRLFGFQWGETEWRISLLPLGGYVKFAGDNPYEEVAPEDRGRGFLEASPGARAAIAVAGPGANFLLTLVIIGGLALAPQADLAAAVGYVKPGSPAARAGLSYGDQVLAIDGEPVSGWSALQEKIRAHAGQRLDLRVVRAGQERQVMVVPAEHEETTPIETIKQGRIGVSSQPRAAEIAVTLPGAPAAKGGLQTFDVITRLAGQPVANFEQLLQLLDKQPAGATLEVQGLRRREVPAPGGTVWVQEPLTASLSIPVAAAAPPSPAAPASPAAPGALDATPSIEQRLERSLGLASADMTLFVVKPGSAAAEAGLRRGDRVVAVQGKPAFWWGDELEQARRAAGTGPFAITVERGGERVDVTVHQHVRHGLDDTGARAEIPELGAAPDGNVYSIEPERITVRYPVGEGLRRAFTGTVGMARSMVLGMARVITGHISSESIGGPLMMADVARKAVDEGLSTFLYMVAVLSLNIGLLNLVPVPVLDGFHVLSAAIEAVRRKPLSLRFREVANVVGVAMVLALMLFALKNDIMRKLFQ